VNPIYFNRQDVKAAIHAPLDVQWSECNNPVFVGSSGDTSPPSAWEVLPRVLKQGVPVVIVTGLADFEIPSKG
jgi:carboxypeptidase D